MITVSNVVLEFSDRKLFDEVILSSSRVTAYA